MGFQWFRELRDHSHHKKEISAALVRARARGNVFASVVSALEHLENGPTEEEAKSCQAIERQRSELSRRTDTIQDIDFGAGDLDKPYSVADQVAGVATAMPVKRLVEFSNPRPWADLLFNIVRLTRPKAAIEMGTCAGISGSYLAAAMRLNGEGHLWTIDGSPEVAKIAAQTFAALGLTSRVTQIVGPFAHTLEPALAHGPFNFAFVDGHHDGAATVTYFSQLKPHLAPSCVVVFDDILWSPDMRQAWKTISADSKVKDAAQIGRFGIAVL